MAKVYPQTLSSSTPLCSKQKIFTLLMKSLIPGSNGCTVFDSDGRIVYRVDNYHVKCSKLVDIMDAKGRVLFTVIAKKLSVLGLWEGYRSAKNKKKPEFRVTKVLNIRKVLGFLGGVSSYKVVVGLDKNLARECVMESQICKSSCRIVDKFGKLVAEVKRKTTNSGVVLGEDVLTMVVEPYEDHCLVMGLVQMWHRSASFILDKLHQNDTVTNPDGGPLSSASTAMAADNPNPQVSLYYQTRAAHHGVVTSDWLAQAQSAVGHYPDDAFSDHYTSGGEEDKKLSVVDEFNNWRKQPDLAEAVAAIRALSSVIRSSQATTMMELEIELKRASDSLKSWDTTSISLTAGCDLFMRYVTRTSALEYEDFGSAKSRLIERAEKFGEISYKARKIIAMLSQDFIFDGCTILVHGFSRVVLEVLRTAAQNKKLFRVFCTEGRPDRTGLRLSNELTKLNVPVKLLIDSAVAYSMDEVDMVFVGADGVVESGGIINMMGTYQIALVAKSMSKPVYVAAESYKFARMYPLDQKDMVPALRPIDFGVPIPSKVEVETSARDYTPPQYLTLLFTDLGVLTPSVVSDELIQLYL
ncbi:uncharacterized protein [Henckelia pumila]|uniref:uncharacterized protein n=1 Tax=Henckelia pumila TaxID=405737 RepID=UPI003C6DCBDB